MGTRNYRKMVKVCKSDRIETFITENSMKSDLKVSKKRKLSVLCVDDGPPSKKVKYQTVKIRNEKSSNYDCDCWFVSYSDGWYPVQIMDLKRMWIEGIVNEYCTIWNPKLPY